MSERPKVIHLKDVHEGQKKLEAKALRAGLDELMADIEAGRVCGVAFAVEYVDGPLGTHHFTTTNDPSRLHMAATLLTQRILESSLIFDDEDYDDDD
jgi:hypothetical protein